MPQSDLVRYDAARKAIAEAKRVDEIKLIRDQGAQLAAAARVANDTEMVSSATEIQMRATIRLGELLKETEKAKPPGSNQHKHRFRDSTKAPTLAERGISKKLSSTAQRLASLPKAQVEQVITAARAASAEVTAAALLGTSPPKKAIDRSATDTTPAVVPMGKPKSQWDRAQDVMDAVKILASKEIAARSVWREIPKFQHKHITGNLQRAIDFLDQLKEADPDG